jgi:zinc/manganese transport system permease protein
VTLDELMSFTGLYAGIGALHWIIRRPLLASAEETPKGKRTAIWDLVFYLSFGLVVTSSVSVAGVLLVFCFLIVPALTGFLFSSRIGGALAIGWAAGCIASAAGIFASFLIDAPTGAVTVLAFGVVLIVAGGVRAFITAPADERVRNRRMGLRVAGLVLCAALGLSGIWLLVAPGGDHPLLAPIELATGIGPERYLTPRERADYFDAAAVERRYMAEVDRLYEIERRSRWQGEELTADEVRRIGSVQQTLTEMGRGERFVVGYLRTRARERERWYVGLPLAAVGLLGLAALMWTPRRRRRPKDQSLGP